MYASKHKEQHNGMSQQVNRSYILSDASNQSSQLNNFLVLNWKPRFLGREKHLWPGWSIENSAMKPDGNEPQPSGAFVVSSECIPRRVLHNERVRSGAQLFPSCPREHQLWAHDDCVSQECSRYFFSARIRHIPFHLLPYAHHFQQWWHIIFTISSVGFARFIHFLQFFISAYSLRSPGLLGFFAATTETVKCARLVYRSG